MESCQSRKPVAVAASVVVSRRLGVVVEDRPAGLEWRRIGRQVQAYRPWLSRRESGSKQIAGSIRGVVDQAEVAYNIAETETVPWSRCRMRSSVRACRRPRIESRGVAGV